MAGMRARHCGLLIVVWALLCLINLGRPSLWDIDEGNNAEAAREMLVSGNYVVPNFNYTLRVDKPALLYWCQVLGYRVFGINEFAARLPSALAALLTILLTYELGRRLFDPNTGLIAGLILGSSLLFCGAAHFANPDALLTACATLTFFFFWRDYEKQRLRWLVLGGLSTGLGMLAKGPVGLFLPICVVTLFLFWMKQSRRWLHPWLAGGVLLFIVVAVPWYVAVGAETRGEFVRGFFLKHNIQRFQAPMENHGGSILYYALVLAVGFAPWSVFTLLTFWHVWAGRRNAEGRTPVDPRYRFLACWMGLYLVFFSLSGTKLPNYVLPVYPAAALLVAHFLERWRQGVVTPPTWAVRLTLVSLALVGVGFVGGLSVLGGAVPFLTDQKWMLPGIERWALLGLIPLGGSLLAGWAIRRGSVTRSLFAVAGSSIAFTALLAALACDSIDRYKAPRPLMAQLRKDQPPGEIYVTCYQYFQPSMVFYCRREVSVCGSAQQVLDMLRYPLPVYVFLPASVWEQLRQQHPGTVRELARHHDLYRRCEIVLVTNQ